MPERKTKVVIYKRALIDARGLVLKTILEGALAKRKTVGKRRESLAPEEESPIWRLVGQFRVEPNVLFGVLMRYAPGTNPAFVVDDESATSLTVEQMAAPVTKEGKRREHMEGMLFFCVIDNHLAMMQSTSLRSDHLEQHLQWLLHKGETLPGTNTIQLVDQPPKATRDRVAQGGVRSLNIGGNLLPTGSFAAVGESPGSEVATTTRGREISIRADASSSAVLSTLKSLMAADKAAKLDEAALLGSNIEYTLEIRYRSKTTVDGQRLMDTLGSALRHADGVETEIQLVDGGTLKGDALRLSGTVRVDTYAGIPAVDEAYEVMRNWLLQKLKSGDIKP